MGVCFPARHCASSKMAGLATKSEAAAQSLALNAKEQSDVDLNELIPCYGTMCGITSLYCKFPDCIGCVGREICCCYLEESVGCKMVDYKQDAEKKCCILQEGGAFCVKPKTCCMAEGQVFCIDQRSAFPMHPKVPTVCTILPFCAVYPSVKCGAKIGTLFPDDKYKKREAGEERNHG